ncbi:MAG: GNAT family N-acetyltransferase, partial [Pseudomonadota bacterium]
MTDPIRVRPAIAADAPALADLLNVIIAAGGTTALETPLTPEDLADWYIAGPSALLCLMAEDSTGALGFQSVGLNSDLPEGWGDIASFARQTAPRPGTGRALFAETSSRAKNAGLIALNATIRADNRVGLAYYSRMGFQDYAVRPAVPLADGS